MRLPSRLRRSRHGIYYFRVIIPKKLRLLIGGRRECLFSLATRDPREASQRSYALSAGVLAVFREVLSLMAGDDKNKKDGLPIGIEGQIRKAIIDFHPDGGLKRIETDPNNPQDAKQAQQLVEALFGKKNAIYTGPSAPQAVNAANNAPAAGPKTLKDSVERYLKVRRDRWKSKTLAEYEAILNRFCEVVGSCDLNHVTQRTIEKYLEVQTKNNLDVRTRDKHVDVIRGFFDEAIEALLFFGKNPAQNARVLTFKQTKALRGTLPFTAGDLQAIFAHATYPDQKDPPHEYWIPLIGLFTGARIGEISQLALSDIVEIDGIPSFDINDDDYKGLKNDDSRRKIPIHTELIRIGFLKFVEDMRSLAESEKKLFASNKDQLKRLERLFPYLTPDTHGGLGGVPSEAFSRLTRKVGVHVHRKKVFHSFRFTANDLLGFPRFPGHIW